MTSMDAEQRQLTQQESDLLFDELTEVRCMRARYASAFVASFGSELAEALRRVAVAGIEVQRRVAAGEMNAQRVGEIAALACSIVACAKFNALVDGVDIPIGHDASCAIVLVIVACGEIADTLDIKTSACAVEFAKKELNDADRYFVLHRIATQRAWEEMRITTLQQYNGGHIDDDEFIEASLELLQNPPTWTDD